jgi:hypothetical protein
MQGCIPFGLLALAIWQGTSFVSRIDTGSFLSFLGAERARYKVDLLCPTRAMTGMIS